MNGQAGDPIVDLTGLKGRYDLTLDFSSYLGHLQPGDMPGALREAMRTQLGLDLEHRKVAIDVLVVDHANRK